MRTHNGHAVIERDPLLLKRYEAAKVKRAIYDIYELSHLPRGLQKRLRKNLDRVYESISREFGNFFVPYLVSSWVDGSGIDSKTEVEEPEFWELKRRKKTWDNVFPEKSFKVSDFDINIYTAHGDAPMAFRALYEIEGGNKETIKIHVYPPKGERRILLYKKN